MTEAVGRHCELDGHHRLVGVLGLVEVELDLGGRAAALLENTVDHAWPDYSGQEVMEHHPLVVPPAQALRLPDYLIGPAEALRAHVVDEGVVELPEGEVKLASDEVLVVAGVADDRRPVGSARQVGPIDVQLSRVVWIVEVALLLARTGSVDGVELEARRAEVGDGVRIPPLQIQRRLVERKVVIDELAKKDEAGGKVRVRFARLRRCARLRRWVFVHGAREIRKELIWGLESR